MFTKNDLATLRLDLVETVPAHALTDVFEVIDNLYTGHLWLDMVEESPDASISLPEQFTPAPDKQLYVSKFEIGTPNFAEFLGLAKDLAPVVSLLSGFVGAGLAFAKLISLPSNFREKKLDMDLKELDLQIKRLQLEQEKRKLEKTGNVSQITINLLSDQTDLVGRAQKMETRIPLDVVQHNSDLMKEVHKDANSVRQICKGMEFTVFQASPDGEKN
jgi:hypothetical protein